MCQRGGEGGFLTSPRGYHRHTACARSSRKSFGDAKFFGGAKISENKVGVVAIDSVKKTSKSELSSRFLNRSKYENSHATFGRIQPIVPGFMRIC